MDVVYKIHNAMTALCFGNRKDQPQDGESYVESDELDSQLSYKNRINLRKRGKKEETEESEETEETEETVFRVDEEEYKENVAKLKAQIELNEEQQRQNQK